MCLQMCSIYGGYTAARLMKMWSKPSWRTTLMVCFAVLRELSDCQRVFTRAILRDPETLVSFMLRTD